MANQTAFVGLLCFALCIGGSSAFAAGSYNKSNVNTQFSIPTDFSRKTPTRLQSKELTESQTEISTELQSPLSSVVFTQNGTEIKQSIDGGKTWENYFPIEEPEYFSYDEFAAWIEAEAENIQRLVDAGEWSEEKAAEALAYYAELLEDISNGVMISKRLTLNDDQLFFSMPNTTHPKQYQTFIFDGKTYTNFGPFDTEEELFEALKEYTEAAVLAGTMTPKEATGILEKYQ